MAVTVYRWQEGNITITSTNADSAERASRAGNCVTAQTVGGI